MIYPCPKPPKKEKKGKLQRRNKSDGQEVEICISPEEWEARREEVGTAAGFMCQAPRCDTVAPLHDIEVEREEGVMPYIIRAGQAAHRTPRRMGGGSRDDKRGNLLWLCWVCHHMETIGRLVIR